MNTAVLDHQTDAQRKAANSAPALVLARAPEHPRGADSPGRTRSESMIELWRIHNMVLRRFALKLTLGNHYRADEVIQETLIRAWRHPEVVDGHAQTIRPWLFTVARNVATDLWRTQSRHDDIIESRPQDRPNPVDGIDQAMTAMDVRAALGQLTPDHRQVIIEIYYLGRSVPEVAQLLNIPEGTVKSRTYYGLRHLKRLLSPAIPASSPHHAA